MQFYVLVVVGMLAHLILKSTDALPITKPDIIYNSTNKTFEFLEENVGRHEKEKDVLITSHKRRGLGFSFFFTLIMAIFDI